MEKGAQICGNHIHDFGSLYSNGKSVYSVKYHSHCLWPQHGDKVMIKGKAVNPYTKELEKIYHAEI